MEICSIWRTGRKLGGLVERDLWRTPCSRAPQVFFKGMFIFVTEASSYSYKYLSMFANFRVHLTILKLIASMKRGETAVFLPPNPNLSHIATVYSNNQKQTLDVLFSFVVKGQFSVLKKLGFVVLSVIIDKMRISAIAFNTCYLF